MLLSETCMLASHESLCHETIQCDNSVLEATAINSGISNNTQVIAKRSHTSMEGNNAIDEM